MEQHNLIQKEGKNLVFTVTDSAGVVVNCVTTTCSLVIKSTLHSATTLVTKSNADFNKTQAAVGKVSVKLTPTNLNFYGDAYMILKIDFGSDSIDKTIWHLTLTQSTE